MEKLRKKIVAHKTPILYTGSSIIKALASIIASFVVAKYVLPEDLGLWTTISLALTYSVFLQGGVINGLNRELPYAYGKGNEDEATRLAAVSQTYITVVTVILFIIGTAISFFYPFEDPKIQWGVLAITFTICFTFYQTYLLSTFRSNNSFRKLTYVQFIDAFVNIISLILIVYYAYYGLIWKTALILFINVILLHFFRPIKVTFLWDKKIISNVLRVGLPIFTLAYLDSFAFTIDKIWLIKYSSREQIGLYTFAYYAFMMVTLFSTSIAGYIYPRMTFNYGSTNSKLGLWNYVKKITIVIIVVLIPFVLVGYVLLPYLIQLLFPKYVLSINAMQILLIAGLFKGSVIGVNVLWSMKKWKYMIYYQTLSAFFLIILTYVFFKLFSNSIEGLSLGVLTACVLNLIIGFFLSYFATHEKIKSKKIT